MGTGVWRKGKRIRDAIYRRAAHVQRVDEALLRQRDASERPDVLTLASLAERLDPDMIDHIVRTFS